MIHLKLLGGLLILGAGGLSALTLVRFERKRLTVLDGWLDLLLYVRGQIDCYLMPLDDILASADQVLLQACGAETRITSLPALFKLSSIYLDIESRRLLSSFVREIGSTYREEQLKRCDYYLEALRARREKIAAELPARMKMGVTVSLCTAIGIAILLW